MKHVRESLTDFENEQFFRQLFESEETEEKEEKTELQDKEKDALAIIKKITNDFEKFKSSAKGEIINFKNFWEENKKTKELFTETGNIYKMHDSSYVVGVLELPTEVLSDGSIDGGMGAVDEPEEEIIEGKPTEEMKEVDDGLGLTNQTTQSDSPLSEAVGEEEDLKDLEDMVPVEDEKPEEKPVDNIPEKPIKEPLSQEEPEQEPTEELPKRPAEEPLETPETSETPNVPVSEAPQTYLVVYDVTGDERDEIFRCGSTNAVKAFRSFYEDTFKSTMKSVIQEYKEKKEQEKIEAEKSEKKKEESEKQRKVKKFLGKVKESLNEKFHGYDDEEDWADAEGQYEHDILDIALNIHTSLGRSKRSFYDLFVDTIADDYRDSLINMFNKKVSAANAAEKLYNRAERQFKKEGLSAEEYHIGKFE
jgi:hypothetical protein